MKFAFGGFEFWIVIFILLIIVALLLPYITTYFFALSALCMSVLVKYFALGFYQQFTIVSALSVVWFCLLVFFNKKVKNFEQETYSDMVGKTVEVTSDIIKSDIHGKVIWSGTTFNAKMFNIGQDAIKGENIIVFKVEGNVLVCTKTSTK